MIAHDTPHRQHNSSFDSTHQYIFDDAGKLQLRRSALGLDVPKKLCRVQKRFKTGKAAR